MALMLNRFVFRVQPAEALMEATGCVMRRAIPVGGVDAVGPFISLIHLGPRQFFPGDPVGLQPLPHAGIEALTIAFEGGGLYRDSLGNVRHACGGDARWVRAGRGIVLAQGASEELQRNGGPVHAVQLWINMPRGRKHEAPAYRHVAADEIPAIRQDHGRVDVRLVSGWLDGRRGPVATFGDPLVAHIEIKAGGRTELAVPRDHEVAIYGLRGCASIGGVGEPLSEGEIAISALDGGRISLAADRDAHVLVFGGAPLDSPIVRQGPFVMNTAEELARVCDDYRSGRMGELAPAL